MVGEMAVHVEEKLSRVDIDFLKNPMDHWAGRTVSRVGDNLDAAIPAELSRHFVHVGSDGVAAGQGSASGFEIGPLDDLKNFLDGLAVQCASAAYTFETVVLRR